MWIFIWFDGDDFQSINISDEMMKCFLLCSFQLRIAVIISFIFMFWKSIIIIKSRFVKYLVHLIISIYIFLFLSIHILSFKDFKESVILQTFHSTETALLKVVNDLFIGFDERKVYIFAFLNMFSAFDTVDFYILLSRLEFSYGIFDFSLSWFKSYLTDRQQVVSVNVSLFNL